MKGKDNHIMQFGAARTSQSSRFTIKLSPLGGCQPLRDSLRLLLHTPLRGEMDIWLGGSRIPTTQTHVQLEASLGT